MKHMKGIFTLIAASTMLVLLGSCGKKGDNSVVVEQSERLNIELAQLASNSPLYLEKAGASYTNDVLGIDLTFADEDVRVKDCTEALVQYIVSVYMKQHADKNLEALLNGLSTAQASVEIRMTDTDGETRVYPISSSRMKQLFTLKPIELNYTEVRDNVVLLLSQRCNGYKEAVNAESVDFSFKGGFAEYTFVFAKPTAYANQTPGSLLGKYINVLRPEYDAFGECRPVIEEMLKSLGFEGYRFIYTTADDSKPLRAVMPWRLLN